MPVIASPTSLTTAGNLIQSIRAKIPDVVNDPNLDGAAFSLSQLLLWINNTMVTICATAPVIRDWYAVSSTQGMDIYILPNHITLVDQLWYDLQPCSKTAEMDDLFTTKITARSWWFGEHSQHAIPRLHVWPAADRSAATTTLTANVASDATSLPIASPTGFMTFGFLTIGTELILYRNMPTGAGNVTNILRGQGGTTASAHNSGDTVTENNIFFKCARLPVALTGPSDLVEVPRGLWPLIELGTIAEIREAEQDHQVATALRREFTQSLETLSSKATFAGIQRHGLQVRSTPPGPELFGGRVYIK